MLVPFVRFLVYVTMIVSTLAFLRPWLRPRKFPFQLQTAAVNANNCNLRGREFTSGYPLYCTDKASKSSDSAKSYSTGEGFQDKIPTNKQWNLKGLKQEVARRHNRVFKKVGKAHEKLSKAETRYQQVVAMVDPPLAVLESCPDPTEYQVELVHLQQHLETLATLEDNLKYIKSVSDRKFKDLVLPVIEELKISDMPPPKQERGPKKIKQKPSSGPRLPYFTYCSKEGIEIRVGRRASDNDELSCNPEYRDSTNWWMHAAGCPGSHVVIRSDADDFPQAHRETVYDAALLAAVNSKAKQSGRVQVNLTRCRNVSKPSGAKPGLVHLRGDVITLSMDLKAETNRLERLLSTAAAASTSTTTGSSESSPTKKDP